MLSWQSDSILESHYHPDEGVHRENLERVSLRIFSDPASKSYHIQTIAYHFIQPCVCETQTQLLFYPQLNSEYRVYLLIFSLSETESLGSMSSL